MMEVIATKTMITDPALSEVKSHLKREQVKQNKSSQN